MAAGYSRPKRLVDYLSREDLLAFESLKVSAGKILGRPIDLAYTDHTIAHKEIVHGHLDSFLGPWLARRAQKKNGDALVGTEAIVLLSATYLHDIGMQIARPDVLASLPSLPDDAKREAASLPADNITEDHRKFARKYHHLIVYDWIRRSRGDIPELDGRRDMVAKVARGHNIWLTDSNSYENFKKAVEATLEPQGTIRTDLLAVFLRLADILDQDKRRVDIKAANRLPVSPASKVHWWRHHYVNACLIEEHTDTSFQMKVAFRLPDAHAGEKGWLLPALYESTVGEIRAEVGRLQQWLEDAEIYIKIPKLTDCALYSSSDATPMPPEVLKAFRDEWDRKTTATPPPTAGMPAHSPAPPHPPLQVACRVGHNYPLGGHFTGRLKERRELTAWFADAGRPPVRVVEAIGGMGKSALAWVWANADVAGQPPDGCAAEAPVAAERRPERILWWNFYHLNAGFPAFLEWAAGELNLKADNDYDRVQALVDALRRNRWLLILDGFERELGGEGAVIDDRPDHCTDPHAEGLIKSLAGLAIAGRVLITSRRLPTPLKPDRHRLELKGLDPADAVRLAHISPRIEGTDDEITTAFARYGFHALSVSLLLGWLRETPGVKRDISELDSRQPDITLCDEEQGRRHHVLALAWDALNTPRRGLLGRIACFRGAVAYKLLRRLDKRPGDKLATDLKDLLRRGLVQREHVGGEERYDLHPLMRDYARKHMPNRADEHNRIRALYADATVPEDTQSLDQLQPAIDRYWHTLMAGRYDEARGLMVGRLGEAIYFRFTACPLYIELLRPMVADEDDGTSRLTDEVAQSWALNGLGISYALLGRPAAAVPLHEWSVEFNEREQHWDDLCRALGNLAASLTVLGQLEEAEAALRQALTVNHDRNSDQLFHRAVVRQLLGRLLARRGALDEAEAAWRDADADAAALNHFQGRSLIAAFRTEAALAAGTADLALTHARAARAFAEETERTRHRHERDFIHVDWLEGAALTALGGDKLPLGGTLLHCALQACRRIRLVELEPAILLALARWHDANREGPQAREHAGEARERATEALALAKRCGYRMDEADAHLLLAGLRRGEAPGVARWHAEQAVERAFCDGPPYAYQPTYDRAQDLLKEPDLRDVVPMPPA